MLGPVGLRVAVLVEIVVEWNSSVTLEIVLNMGSSNMGNQGKMGFSWDLSGGSREILGNLVFWLVFGFWSPSLPPLISTKLYLCSPLSDPSHL